MNIVRLAIGLSVLSVFPGFAQTAPEKTPPANTAPTEKSAAAEKASPYLKRADVSQTADGVRITANSPRPLEQTLQALQQKYGWVVNYEDPQFSSHLDFVDSPSEQAQVPAGGNFTVEFPAAAPDEEKTLRLVVDAYNQSKNPGRFEVRHGAPAGFYIVGTAAHDEKGAISQQKVLLDFPVTLPTRERTIVETIDLICQQIAAQSHTAVTLGIFPRTFLSHTPVKVGGTKVPARELLLQSLAAAHHTLYWRLLFDPGSKGYFLSIHSVKPA